MAGVAALAVLVSAAPVGAGEPPDAGASSTGSDLVIRTYQPASVPGQSLAVSPGEEPVEVRVAGLDRAGESAPLHPVLASVATGQVVELEQEPDGNAYTGAVPPGAYTLTAAVDVSTEEDPGVAVFQRPRVSVGADGATFELDARETEPVRAVVDAEQTRATGGLQAAALHRAGDKTIGVTATSQQPDTTVYAEPIQEEFGAGGVFWYLTSLLETADVPEPRAYQLAFIKQGGIPGDLELRVTDDELARVDSRFLAQGEPGRAERSNVVNVDGFDVHDFALSYEVDLPARVTELFTPDGVRWMGTLRTISAGGVDVGMTTHGPSGEQYTGRSERTWNAPSLGPVAQVSDTGNGLTWQVDPMSPGAPGTLSYPAAELPGVSGWSRLWRDGTPVHHEDSPMIGSYDAPAPGDYELEVRADRDVAWSRYGTRSTARWGFTIGERDGTFRPIKVLDARISGRFDDLGRAPANRGFRLDLGFEYLGSGPEPTVESAQVEVSFDGGETWNPMTTWLHPRGWRTWVQQPPDGAKTVSVRLRAEDANGHTLDQEVLDAYGLAPQS